MATQKHCKLLSKLICVNPMASKMRNYANITNNTNSPGVLKPEVGLSPKTLWEWVLLAILVQFHTLEAIGLKMLVVLGFWIALHAKALWTHSNTNVVDPTSSQVWNCTSMTNNTNSPGVLEPAVGLSPKTLWESVLLVILVQFHTLRGFEFTIWVSLWF